MYWFKRGCEIEELIELDYSTISVGRKRLKGNLLRDPITGDFKIQVGSKEYKVLKASVTYFHGDDNDEVIALVPQDGESVWAAVENIINKAQSLDRASDGLNSENKENSPDDLNGLDI